MKKPILISIIVLLICFELCGCINRTTKQKQEADTDKFAGTWTSYENSMGGEIVTYSFKSNGTLIVNKSNSDYSLKTRWEWKSSQIIMYNETGFGFNYDYSFTKNDMILTLTGANGGIFVLIKQTK
jgi:hypothetical protein